MSAIDWVVLIVTIAGIVSFGLWKSRGSKTVSQYLLAGKTMPWYAMGLSIMATQASAVTFISTTGQAYVDGMRFVQFYFGLPVAMVILSATAVPIFHRAGVYTAYEYLERRFDARTRALGSIIFLIQRGFGVGVALYAPAIVLAVVFGWPDQITTLLIGLLVIAYTVAGGIPAVTWTDVLQMSIILCGLVLALILIVAALPIPFVDAVYLAGSVGKLNAVDLHFDPNNRYTLWSGLIGGSFLALAYFGCDQSQVQRYLTGKSIAQSKLSLLFNAMAKVPMQFFILFVGAMVFVFYLFVQPPVLFQKAAVDIVHSTPESQGVEAQFARAFEERKAAAQGIVESRKRGSPADLAHERDRYRVAQKELAAARGKAVSLYESQTGAKAFNDTNYIFLSFVTRYLPVGVVGLVIAVIFAAAMSSSSGEINSLATVTVIDIYKRHFRKDASDGHYLMASRLATAFWGLYAVFFAQYVKNLGSLIEAVNMVGSLFYGTLLGVFTLAFFFKRVGGTGPSGGCSPGRLPSCALGDSPASRFCGTTSSAQWWWF